MTVDDAARDAEARFTALVREVAEPIRRFLARRTDPDTAEDVLADALMVLWRRLGDVPGDPLPWAYGVAKNCLANADRASRRRARLIARLVSTTPPESMVSDPSDRDEAFVVRAALSRMRPGDAEVLRLWAWEGLEAAGIAAVLGISANAAAIRLHRGKARLRAELEKDDAPGKSGRGPGHVEDEGRTA
jgi:RNA polymerase sigma-70 factor (ECF subfamily)